jgi:hypothetical protein
MHEELAPHGLEIVSVALDEREAARPWVEDAAVTYTVLVDPDHVVASRYRLVNIPSVVWIDEQDRIVRPPAMGFGDNTWKDFTGVDAAVHKDELRRWVKDDELAYDQEFVREHTISFAPEQQLAREERRIGAWLLRSGHEDAGARHLERAVELAPMDWTVRRGTMPLRGADPFGDEFFGFLGEWMSAGSPGYDWGDGALQTET